MLDISLLILSWKGHQTLINTLESYKNNGLLDVAREKIIYFQEISEEDKKIALKYGCTYIGDSRNTGIGTGLYELAKAATSEYILFLENDWELICNKVDTEKRLTAGISLLSDRNVNVIRYRHRYKFGLPNYALQFEGKELSSPFCLLESSYWIVNPEIKFPDYITKQTINSEYFYLAASKNANFTNNPTMYKKKFYIDIVTPFTKEGFEPESSMQKWWEKQNYIVAQGEGLFYHNRIDR